MGMETVPPGQLVAEPAVVTIWAVENDAQNPVISKNTIVRTFAFIKFGLLLLNIEKVFSTLEGAKLMFFFVFSLKFMLLFSVC